MTKDQELSLTRLNSLARHFEAHRAIFEKDARLSENLAAIHNIINTVEQRYTSFLGTATTGYTAAERRYEDAAAEAVMRLTNVVSEFALSQGDELLLSMVKFERSDLDRLRRLPRIGHLRKLVAVCETQAPGIPGCTLTAEDFRNAKANIEILATIKDTRTDKRSGRKSDRLRIGESIRQGTPLLQKMDLLMRNYESAHPDFYKDYEMIRKLPARAGRKLGPEELERRAANRAKKKAAETAKKEQAAAAKAAEKNAAAAKAVAPVEAKPEPAKPAENVTAPLTAVASGPSQAGAIAEAPTTDTAVDADDAEKVA